MRFVKYHALGNDYPVIEPSEGKVLGLTSLNAAFPDIGY